MPGYGAVVMALLLGTVALAATEDAVDVVVSKAGFRPSVIRARRGETLRLKVSASDGEHCFAVDAFRIEKRITSARPILVDITPDRVGTFDVLCCLEPEERARATAGRLVVGD